MCCVGLGIIMMSCYITRLDNVAESTASNIDCINVTWRLDKKDLYK
jgi:hypothetical protein